MKRPFEEWLRLVDKELIKACTLDRDGLPDCEYALWYEQGLSPARAAKRALREARTY